MTISQKIVSGIKNKPLGKGIIEWKLYSKKGSDILFKPN